jgi:hypothetical protein
MIETIWAQKEWLASANWTRTIADIAIQNYTGDNIGKGDASWHCQPPQSAKRVRSCLGTKWL